MDRQGQSGEILEKQVHISLTNVLETNGTRGVIKVYTADVQGVQLCYMMTSHLHTG